MAAPQEDERLLLLESLATALLRVRPDKWAKFVASEETAVLLDKFFKQPELLELVLALTPAGQLQPTTSFPPALKGKGFYCVKRKEENITGENCRSALLVGDVGPSPVEQLITVLLEVGSCQEQAWAEQGECSSLGTLGLWAALATCPGGLQNKLKFTEENLCQVLALTLR